MTPTFQSLAALLLADPSPCLRTLTLRELLGRPEDDPEVQELSGLREKDSLVVDLLEKQRPDGSWETVGPAAQAGKLRATSLALARLGYLGLQPDHLAIRRGSEFLFSCQAKDGSWRLPDMAVTTDELKGYSMIPLQTTLPLQGLAVCGYATDSRAERAYDWLLARRLPDGAWPTGIASGIHPRVAGYRRLAHSRRGCRSNTTGALICLAHHPRRRRAPEAGRALDLLLGRETRERHPLGFEVARLIGVEPARGFLTYFARFDLALLLDLGWRVGATQDDERVAGIVEFVREMQGPYGLWEYLPRPPASRWVTFDLLRSLSRLDQATDWLSLEPRTPFQPYARRARRF